MKNHTAQQNEKYIHLQKKAVTVKIALVISVILQFAAAILALSLVKRTRSNIAWWLISFAFLLMAFRLLFETLQVFNPHSTMASTLFNTWLGILISILMLVSLLFIKRIFNIQKQIELLRKQNESRVLSAIIKTEERERQNFAKELHDGMGPLLSSVKMNISATHDLTEKQITSKLLSNTETLVDEAINTLKEISNKLSPHILNNFGVHKAVKSFINKLQVQGTPKIQLTGNIENKRFSYNIEVVLYRVICELLVNTLKHAKASHIRILMVSTGKVITVDYTDDGIGFDTEKPVDEQKGLGYSNMESRIRSLNGIYEFFSKPNEGVRVHIEINEEP